MSAKCFKNYCNCGGYASSMSGRNPEHPHMVWCAQYEEWEEYMATHEPLTRKIDPEIDMLTTEEAARLK